jgi:AcrR family transcriptional regulator
VARPLSEEKKNAIIAAATRVIASFGTSATTAAIAAEAGVATGSLFTYYPTKDALLNALFFELKSEIADALLVEYPAEASPKDRAWHIWTRYIDWALKFPDKRRASDQVSLSCRISPEVVDAAVARWGPINNVVQDCIPERSPLRAEFGTGIMIKLAELAIDFAEREPDHAQDHTRIGFDACWRALSH